MVSLTTSRFGEIEVKESDLIKMPSGIIGFPELTQFVIFDHDKDSPFKWFQSLDDGSIAFVLINPLLFKPDYKVEVIEAEIGDLHLESEDDAVISVIVTMPGNPQNMTANLKAPLLFNLKNRTGKQVILNSSNYSTRHNIIEEMKAYTKAAGVEVEQVEEVIEEQKNLAQSSKQLSEEK